MSTNIHVGLINAVTLMEIVVLVSYRYVLSACWLVFLNKMLKLRKLVLVKRDYLLVSLDVMLSYTY